LQVQDVERRRIAQDLHDGAAQQVFAVSLSLSRARSKVGDPRLATELQEAESLCREALQQIRTVSYLLHPVLLDEAGLAPALRAYVDGYTARSGIEVTVDAAVLERLPPDVERALFRIVQEALSNVQRHARAARARVRLYREENEVVLSVRDDGRGMPSDSHEARLGVGLVSMRERIHQLGGFFTINSSSSGTEIRAAVPAGPHIWAKSAT
jgi:two-component system, NarL family, sensor kinase